MKVVSVEASWEENYPTNWTLLGTVLIVEEAPEPPSFLLVDGIKYERKP